MMLVLRLKDLMSSKLLKVKINVLTTALKSVHCMDPVLYLGPTHIPPCLLCSSHTGSLTFLGWYYTKFHFRTLHLIFPQSGMFFSETSFTMP